MILRDETGQPLVPTDESGQIIEQQGEAAEARRADSIVRPEDRAGGFDPNALGGERSLVGKPVYHARVGLVEGYNSNVVQTQSVLNGPVTEHKALFTGMDASLALIRWTTSTDQEELHLGVRGQHYEPLDGYGVADDGTALGSYARSFTLGLSTVMSVHLIGTITSANSAVLSDGPLFQIDPSNLTRTYTLSNGRITLAHELSPRWRLIAAAEVWLGTTVQEAPIVLSSTQSINHRGIDSVSPAAEVTLNHDLDPYNILGLNVRYQIFYVPFTLDYTKAPPQYIGVTSTQFGTSELRWTHAYSEAFRSLFTLGAGLSQPPTGDVDQRPILTPSGSAKLTYAQQYWWASVDANYSYGSANPRLGFGPLVGAGLIMQGVPYAHGHWNRLSVLANASANRAVLLQSSTSFSRLTYVGANAELRYGLNDWIGVVAGYNFRYSLFEGSGAYPPLLRHIFFLGVSGYFDNDKSLPTLDSFAGAVAPPG